MWKYALSAPCARAEPHEVYVGKVGVSDIRIYVYLHGWRQAKLTYVMRNIPDCTKENCTKAAPPAPLLTRKRRIHTQARMAAAGPCQRDPGRQRVCDSTVALDNYAIQMCPRGTKDFKTVQLQASFPLTVALGVTNYR